MIKELISTIGALISDKNNAIFILPIVAGRITKFRAKKLIKFAYLPIHLHIFLLREFLQ